MFAGLLGSLIDSVVKAAFGFFATQMANRGLIQQGQAQQSAKETATAGATQAKMAQAETDAPKTKDAATARLDGGNA